MPVKPGKKRGSSEMMTQHKIAAAFVAFMVLTGWLVSSGPAETNAQPTRSPEQTRTTGFSDAGKAALSRQMRSAVSRGDTQGVVALVVGRGGVLYQGAAGKLDVAQGIAMPINAIFSIASMTKPVTSVAIMMLFEEGQLKLDDPVSKYLTGFDNLQYILSAKNLRTSLTCAFGLSALSS
jgi:CubicO group peptidase (beta-lactamase class C family)